MCSLEMFVSLRSPICIPHISRRDFRGKCTPKYNSSTASLLSNTICCTNIRLCYKMSTAFTTTITRNYRNCTSRRLQIRLGRTRVALDCTTLMAPDVQQYSIIDTYHDCLSGVYQRRIPQTKSSRLNHLILPTCSTYINLVFLKRFFDDIHFSHNLLCKLY